MARLIFKLNDGEELIYDLEEKRAIIGRGPKSDIPLPDESVSTRHAMLDEIDGVFTITDLHSTNGTEVNGKTVVESKLKHGDHLVVGEIDCMFQGDESRPVDFEGIDLQIEKKRRKAEAKRKEDGKEEGKAARNREEDDQRDWDEDDSRGEDRSRDRSDERSAGPDSKWDDDEDEDGDRSSDRKSTGRGQTRDRSDRNRKRDRDRDRDRDGDGDDERRLSGASGRAAAVSAKARSQRRVAELKRGGPSSGGGTQADGFVWLIWGVLLAVLGAFIGLSMKHHSVTGRWNFMGDFVDRMSDMQAPVEPGAKEESEETSSDKGEIE